MKLLIASLAILLALIPAVQCTPTHQFDHFFPGWNHIIQRYLRDNCTEEYAAYKTGNVNLTLGVESLVNPVIDCILEQFPNSRQAELAASNLVLGLIPTILQSIGSSTAETALVGIRRPILGFLLAAGSPTVAIAKSSSFAKSLADFVNGGDPRDLEIPGFGWSRVPSKWALLISAGEYLVVGGAVANVVLLAYELGVHAVAIFAPNTIFGVPLWTFLAAIIHVVSCLCIWLRVRVVHAKEGDDFARRTEVAKTGLPTELIPAAFHSSRRLEWRDENLWFYALSWIVALGILIQVVLGTLVLSGLLFFSLVDSLSIVLRYMLSAIACRAIVRLELSGMIMSVAPNTGKDNRNTFRIPAEPVLEGEQIMLRDWKNQSHAISDDHRI
ncbi:hypothetical protein F5Y18DRAFT_381383 [Xylariaceae sp. FL1019]|nr:hypothetical protein F5Y18DRAFT_381383 [Xylariaceae sp. FL1019]